MTTEDQQLQTARDALANAITDLTDPKGENLPTGAILIALREHEAALLPRARAERDAKAAEVARLTEALGDTPAPAKPRAPRTPKSDAITMPVNQDALVTRHLRTIPGTHTVDTIAKATGMPRRVVLEVIARLGEDVLASKAGKGKRYEWAGKAAAE